MKRHLCLWIPNWPVQRLRSERPELSDRPLVVHQSQRGRDIVTACCPVTHRCGVQPGLPVTEARLRLDESAVRAEVTVFIADDPPRNLVALRRLAWECEAFSPLVGLEDADEPSSLLCDISGCGDYFGGEATLADRLLSSMRQRRLQVRVGVADTIGTAWAMARYSARSQQAEIVPAGEQTAALGPLPVAALRLSPAVLDKLHSLDVRTIGQLLKLPRRSLFSRFGKELPRRIDQAFGECEELIVPERAPQPVEVRWESEWPLRGSEALETVVEELLEELLNRLSRTDQGVVELLCRFAAQGVTPEQNAASADAPQTRTVEFPVRLVRPTTELRHLNNLLQMHWERQSLPAEITSVTLRVVESRARPVQQHHLWATSPQHASASDKLIEKLTSRLGREAVLRPLLQSEHQPELAVRYQTHVAPSEGSRPAELNRDRLPPLCRPLWLHRRPVPVDVLCVIPDGPPWRLSHGGQDFTITFCRGPERITTGWWRGDHVRRDYYLVQLPDHRWLWIYHDWVSKRWYVHGVFD